MKSKTRKLSNEESEKVVNTMENYLRDQILQSLGQRKISKQNLKELAAYWTAATVSVPKLIDIPDDFKMTDEKIQRYFTNITSGWERGLESYTEMAGSTLVDIIDERMQRDGNVKILDIGCGNATFLRELQNRYGDSIKCHGVAHVRSNDTDTIDFRLALAEVLPEEWADKFDLVTCFESSMYFWDQGRAFDESLRVLRPEGRLFYGTNNLKLSVNQKILTKKLDLDRFSYTCPRTSGRAGETYSGVSGKLISNFMSFFEMLKTLTDGEGKFKRYEKKFDMKKVEVEVWCSETLQVRGLEK